MNSQMRVLSLEKSLPICPEIDLMHIGRLLLTIICNCSTAFVSQQTLNLKA